MRNDKGDLKGFQANFETICHNLTPVNQKASKEKKRMYTFEKTTELVWQGLSRQCFLQNQLMESITLIDDQLMYEDLPPFSK